MGFQRSCTLGGRRTSGHSSEAQGEARMYVAARAVSLRPSFCAARTYTRSIITCFRQTARVPLTALTYGSEHSQLEVPRTLRLSSFQ
jgi:hypothetical protein